MINSPLDIDVRVALRSEFQRIGLPDVIKKLKEGLKPDTETDLETQIDVYEEEGNLDHNEIHDRFASMNINVKYLYNFMY